MGQVFNKALDATNKKERLLKRLKNVEDQSKLNKEDKNNQLGAKSVEYRAKEELSQEAKNMLEKLNNQEKLINYRKVNFRGCKNVDYNFSDFRPLRELFRVIYYGEIAIPSALREQDDFDERLKILKKYKANKPDYKKIKIIL